MAAGDLPDEDGKRSETRREKPKRYSVVVSLNHEQMAAAEGWRAAHGIADRAEALGELVRLGLLGEVAKIYRLVGGNRSAEPQDGSKRPS